jgi:hypothetical protein
VRLVKDPHSPNLLDVVLEKSVRFGRMHPLVPPALGSATFETPVTFGWSALGGIGGSSHLAGRTNDSTRKSVSGFGGLPNHIGLGFTQPVPPGYAVPWWGNPYTPFNPANNFSNIGGIGGIGSLGIGGTNGFNNIGSLGIGGFSYIGGIGGIGGISGFGPFF